MVRKCTEIASEWGSGCHLEASIWSFLVREGAVLSHLSLTRRAADARERVYILRSAPRVKLQTQLPPDRSGEFGGDEGVGGGEPVGQLGIVDIGHGVETHPFGPGQIGSRAAAAAGRQRFEGDIGGLEGERPARA